MEGTSARAELAGVRQELYRWRASHGGRGRPIPQELWAAATAVALSAGVEETARALGVDVQRLARRVAACSGSHGTVTRGPVQPCRKVGFVELDAQRVFGVGKTVIRVTRRDGEQLEVEVEGGAASVAQVARALWGGCA